MNLSNLLTATCLFTSSWLKLKKRLLKSVMSNSNSANALALSELGSSVTLLSPKQLSMIPGTDLKEFLKTLGPNIQWTKAQLRTLVKKQLGNKMVSLQGW